MGNLNKQLKELYGITDEDYAEWCKKEGKSLASKDSKKAFYEYIRKNRLEK